MRKFSENIEIINAKLQVPHLPDTIIRERLYSYLKKINDLKVISIIAGAGHGKTTLTAQACRDIGLKTIWYRLDESDTDFLTFIQYLVAGFRQYYSEFGQSTIEIIKNVENLNNDKKKILNSFLNEIDVHVVEDITIVLDDFHLVQKQNDILDILEILFEHLSSLVHFIIIGRTDPNLNLTKILARRQAAQITEFDLMFNIHEIEALYKEIFGYSLRQKHLEKLYEISNGWIAGLILFKYQMKGKSTLEIEDQFEKMEGTQKLVYSYLEENIFSQLSDELKEFLLCTSIFDRIDIDFCNKLLNIDNSKEVLVGLEKEHLFTFPFDDGRRTYYYHHLFQDYLKEKLISSKTQKAILSLHQRAGGIFEQEDMLETALHHYILAKNIKKSGEILSELSRTFVNDGRINLFMSILKKMPEDQIQKYPWIYYYYGRALELMGKIYEAIEVFKRSHEIFKLASSQKGEMLSSNRVFSNLYVLGQFEKAEAELNDLLPMIKPMKRRYLDALGHLIFIASHIGKLEAADNYYKLATNALDDSIDRDLHAWIYLNYGFRYFASGDLIEAIQFAGKSYQIGKKINQYVLQTFSAHLKSISNYYLGNYKIGYETAKNGLMLCEEKGIRESTHAWLLIDACFCSAAIGKLKEAIEYGKNAIEICKETESPWSQAWVYHALLRAYEFSGDLTAAEKAGADAVFTLKKLSLPFDEGVIKSGLASILIRKGQFEDANKLLSDAEFLLINSPLNLSHVKIYFAHSLQSSDTDKAIKKLVQGLSLCQVVNNDSWLDFEKWWIVPLLVHLYSKGEMKEYITKLIARFGLDAFHELRKIEKSKKELKPFVYEILKSINELPSPGLKVTCFGRFKVYRGNDEITQSYWSSEKAKILFKHLILQRKKGYTIKDKLIEMLWPEDDPEKSGNRFHVALSSLRKTLEPELVAGSSSSYIIRKKDSYWLDLKEDGDCDMEEFDKLLLQARTVHDSDEYFRYFKEAESLYTGELFNEDRYAEWSFGIRDEYRQKYLSILSQLIIQYEKEMEYHKCIDLSKQYLRIDRYDEEIHCNLMKLYVKIDNLPMAIKVFKNCSEIIEKDLNCPLGEEILAYYTKIVKKV